MEIISVRKVKRPIGWGRWQAYVLDADEYGTWTYTPAGSIFTSDDGSGVVSTCEVARDADGRGGTRYCCRHADRWAPQTALPVHPAFRNTIAST